MGVDHRVDGDMPPYFSKYVGCNVFAPPLLLGDLLNNDCLCTPIKHVIMHSKTHLICLAAGLRLDPLGEELSTGETTNLLGTENGL